MDYQNNNQSNNENPLPDGSPYPNPNLGQPAYYQPDKHDSFAKLSLLLGVLSIVTGFMMTVYPPIVLGGIAIIIALLSRGKEVSLRSKAKIGIICGIAGILLNICIVVGSVYVVFSNPEYTKQFDALYEQLYGESFEDTLEEATGKEYNFN